MLRGMNLPPIIVLIGLRGSGKTTVARAMARVLRRVAVDLDDRTAEVLGHASAGEALRALGEEAFRAGEARALEPALEERGTILALGGGTPTHAPSATLLRNAQVAGRAFLVYLRARPETLAARLGGADLAQRPSLTGRGTIEEIGELFAARDPLYTRIVQAIVEVDGHADADDTLSAVLNAIPRD